MTYQHIRPLDVACIFPFAQQIIGFVQITYHSTLVTKDIFNKAWKGEPSKANHPPLRSRVKGIKEGLIRMIPILATIYSIIQIVKRLKITPTEDVATNKKKLEDSIQSKPIDNPKTTREIPKIPSIFPAPPAPSTSQPPPAPPFSPAPTYNQSKTSPKPLGEKVGPEKTSPEKVKTPLNSPEQQEVRNILKEHFQTHANQTQHIDDIENELPESDDDYLFSTVDPDPTSKRIPTLEKDSESNHSAGDLAQWIAQGRLNLSDEANATLKEMEQHSENVSITENVQEWEEG